jgi:hypothetical protein
MNNRQNDSKKASFWSTLPGTITKITALIVAITGLIAALSKIDILEDVCKKVDTLSYALETKWCEELPYGLTNSMESQDSLYWFHVQADNQSRLPLHLFIYFEVRDGPAQVSPEPIERTVDPGEKYSENVDPRFYFLKSDTSTDFSLQVTWEIKDDKENHLRGNTEETRLLSKHKLCCNLTTCEGNPVPKDFLIASLTAWVQSSDDRLKKLAEWLLEECESDTASLSLADKWFASCYRKLFGGDLPAITIASSFNIFRMQGVQTIRTPSQILQQGKADPLEAALLVAALSKPTLEKLGVRLVLFTLPESADSSETRSFLLSWPVEDKWCALDLVKVTMSYEDNQNVASSRVAKLLEESPMIIDSLNTDGVYIDEKECIVALDFAEAAGHFGIRGLP